ncbi:TPA: hypothetical protein ACX6R6_001784 [Photobacterium damselae]
MNRYRYKMRIVLFFTIIFRMMSAPVFADELFEATITGNQLTWDNAFSVGDEITTFFSEPSSLIMPQLPANAVFWKPGLAISPVNQISFTSPSASGMSIDVTVKHVGNDFYQSNYDISQNGKGSCSSANAAKPISVREYSKSECISGVYLNSKSGAAHIPFDSYRSVFKITDIVSEFKRVGAPKGDYKASITVPIYYQNNNEVQRRSTDVSFLIHYNPSSLDDVKISGNGVMALDYDTKEHTVKGKTKFKVSVKGELSNGLKMTFKSSDIEKDFSLEHKNSKRKIPYSLICDMCDINQVILDGRMLRESAIISSAFKNLDFNLNFYFNNMYFNKVDKGEYFDEVTIRFEPNL